MSFGNMFGGYDVEAKAVCKSPSMGYVPRTFYNHFLRDKGQSNYIPGGKENIISLLKYTEGKDTKLILYETLRQKSFHNIPDSRIAKEIAGVCMLFAGAINYLWLSLKMARVRG